jgi:site-specific DNA-adenine methylase
MTLAAPFPYFGGKRRAASTIWAALGDPSGYVEPFAGSAAVLLARPDFNGRRTETLNDADGWLVNTWRAIQLSPGAVARHTVGPVTEIDYHARLAWLSERRNDGLVSWLEGDPENHDAKAAAWWLYVMACGIGDPFGGGPWRVIDGRLTDTRRELPHLGDAGQGVSGYMHQLAGRLLRVRITCGSWERVVKPSVTRAGTGGDGSRTVLLDPPYATSGDLYAASATDQGDISTAVRQWCESHAGGFRVVLCGFNDEHDDLLASGWARVDGKSGGGAGYNKDGAAGRRERLWLSPECLSVHQQADLFAPVSE